MSLSSVLGAVAILEAESRATGGYSHTLLPNTRSRGRNQPRIDRLCTGDSSMNFSIYLIHVNGLVWDNLIMNRFAFIVDYNILFGTIITLIICMLIYVACLMIDYPREMIFNHLNLKRRISNIENRLTQRIDCMARNRRRFFE